jgi:hypothetical protein
MNKASRFRGNSVPDTTLEGRSRAQIAEAVRIRQERAKIEISEALDRFGAVSSRRFPKMPRIRVVSDEERESVWGRGAKDQGDFIASDRIRLSEGSSRNTAFHEAMHYVRHYAKLDRDGSIPNFTRRAISEMCSIFVAASMSGHDILSDPISQALSIYNLEPGGRELGSLSKSCDYYFFRQVRGLLEASGEKEAVDFFLAAGRDAVELSRYERGAREVSEYSFGRALGVIHMAHNGLSIERTLRQMMTINYDGLLKVIVGQRVNPESNGFLDLVESRILEARNESDLGKNKSRSTTLKASDFTSSLIDMTGSVANTYYHILRNYHHDRRNISQGFFMTPTARLRRH